MTNLEGLLNLQEEIRGNIFILRMKGRLDAVSSPAAERKIFDFINQGQHKVLLNFSGVNYLSSIGLRMLLSITKKVKALSGKLVICCVTASVMDVLKVSGFEHALEFAATEEEGLAKFY